MSSTFCEFPYLDLFSPYYFQLYHNTDYWKSSCTVSMVLKYLLLMPLKSSTECCLPKIAQVTPKCLFWQTNYPLHFFPKLQTDTMGHWVHCAYVTRSTCPLQHLQLSPWQQSMVGRVPSAHQAWSWQLREAPHWPQLINPCPKQDAEDKEPPVELSFPSPSPNCCLIKKPLFEENQSSTSGHVNYTDSP